MDDNMSWGTSILIAVILGAIGAVAAFGMASLAVDWLRISSREGEAGYFAVLMGLIGIIAGMVIGIVVSRYMGGAGFAGFAKAFGVSLGILMALVGAGGGLARLQYDPIPMADGRHLSLEVEVRGFPALDFDPATAKSQSWEVAPFHAWLGAFDGDSRGIDMRFGEARKEADRWIVPGSVLFFTGKKELYFGVQVGRDGPNVFMNADAPRPLDPAKSEWSTWRIAAADPAKGDQAGKDGFAIRYRLVFAPED